MNLKKPIQTSSQEQMQLSEHPYNVVVESTEEMEGPYYNRGALAKTEMASRGSSKDQLINIHNRQKIFESQ